MEDIQKIHLADFEPILKQFGYSKETILDSIILNQIKDRWEDIIGTVYVNQAQPFKVSGDTLFIRVSHSAYKMEISFMKSSMLKTINKLYPRPIISKIEIVIGNLQYTVSKKTKVENDTLEGKSELVDAIQKEEDEFIRDKLLNFIKKLKIE